MSWGEDSLCLQMDGFYTPLKIYCAPSQILPILVRSSLILLISSETKLILSVFFCVRNFLPPLLTLRINLVNLCCKNSLLHVDCVKCIWYHLIITLLHYGLLALLHKFLEISGIVSFGFLFVCSNWLLNMNISLSSLSRIHYVL